MSLRSSTQTEVRKKGYKSGVDAGKRANGERTI
ncbi:hypothetical protein Patl1_34430 [Pistacia atlantica]|uniref:Uncharacterized protein n=1 Tax=Pistacia atlantica TaxID=434234 RepID=A0ACC0ZQC0_9ROSI|nr:hypothetical protein Patl1_34430 [Pistacia atlantica]